MVRVTAASGTRRVDLVLPGAVPVAELVPELARSVGLLDGATVHGGYRLVLPDGHALVPDAGLIRQGVEDGALLTVSAGALGPQPRIYDDVVEAMTEVVESELEPWRPADGRWAALLAAALFLLLGAGTLLLERGSPEAADAAAVIAVMLLGAATAFSRTGREPAPGVVAAWLAAVYAAVAGAVVVRDQPLTGAGLALLAAGVASVMGLRRGRALAVPPVVVGGVLAGCGVLLHRFEWRPAVLLSSVLVAVVVGGSVFPLLALSMTGADIDELSSPDDLTAGAPLVDPARVSSDAHTAHELILAVSATVGVLLVTIAPLAVSLGAAGAALGVVASLVVMARTRQHRSRSEVLVGLVSGTLGLIVTGLSVLWMRSDWRPALGVVVVATGGALVGLATMPATLSLRRGRLGEVADAVCLLALPPLLVVATGALSQVSL